MAGLEVPPEIQAILDTPGITWTVDQTDQVFRWLYDTFLPVLLSTALAVLRTSNDDAEDMLQDFWAKKMFNDVIPNYDPARPDAVPFVPFVRFCLRKFCQSRKAKISQQTEKEVSLESPARDDNAPPIERVAAQEWRHSPEQAYVDEERSAAINKCLENLGASHREVVILFYMQMKSEKEIAAILGIPLHKVKSRLHRARHILQRDPDLLQLWRDSA